MPLCTRTLLLEATEERVLSEDALSAFSFSAGCSLITLLQVFCVEKDFF